MPSISPWSAVQPLQTLSAGEPPLLSWTSALPPETCPDDVLAWAQPSHVYMLLRDGLAKKNCHSFGFCRNEVGGRQHCRLSICEYWLSWTNTVSEQKIPITILILKRGPCLFLASVSLFAFRVWEGKLSNIEMNLSISKVSLLAGCHTFETSFYSRKKQKYIF